MTQIVLIGNTLEGLQIIERLITRDANVTVTVLASPDERPHARQRLCDFIGGRIPFDQFIVQPRFDPHKVRVRNGADEQIDRILFRKRQVILKNKDKLPYDYLILSDTGTRACPNIKGTQKTGVFGFLNLSDAQGILQRLGMTETIIISTSTVWGLHLAESLSSRTNKEVIVLTSIAEMCRNSMDVETFHDICRLAQPRGVRVMDGQMSEILGDQDVKAIRLQTGKVMACQMVIFPDAPMDLRILQNTEIGLEGKIPVDEFFQTRVQGVYALAGIGDSTVLAGEWLNDSYLKLIDQQTALVVGHIRDEDIPAWIPPLRQKSFLWNNIAIDFIGDTCCRDGISFANMTDEETDGACRVFIKQNCLNGAILMHRSNLKDRLIEAIVQRKEWEDVKQQLFSQPEPSKMAVSSNSDLSDRDTGTVAVETETPGDRITADSDRA